MDIPEALIKWTKAPLLNFSVEEGEQPTITCNSRYLSHVKRIIIDYDFAKDPSKNYVAILLDHGTNLNGDDISELKKHFPNAVVTIK
jgi:hypothetical protein